MSRRALTGRLLSPFALANAAIAWSALIGAIGVLAFVPEQGAAPRDWGALVLVALVAEAAFAAVIVALRALGAAAGPVQVGAAAAGEASAATAAAAIAPTASRRRGIAVPRRARGARAPTANGLPEC